MPSAAAQDVLQAILERRAAQKRRAPGATAAPMVLPFAQRVPLKVYLNAGERDRAMGDQAPLPFSNRIAGAFDASEGMPEPSQALYAAKHQRAMDVLGNRPPEGPGFRDAIASLASLGPRAWGGAQKMWQAAPMAAEALYNDPLGSINSVGLAGQAATDAIVQGMAKPFMQFGDPNVDPVENAADLATTVMGMSSVVPAEANSLRMGIKAYHGSPHSFERFDASKIGTGEGAQAYGHGLYFAEHPETAGVYKEMLTAKHNPADQQMRRFLTGADENAPGEFWPEGTDFGSILGAGEERASISNAELVKRSLANLERVKKGKGPLHAAALQKAQATVDYLKSNPQARFTGAPYEGRMYEVDIAADPEHFLDWDKPLSEQPKAIQDAMVTPEGQALSDKLDAVIVEKNALARDRDPKTNMMRNEKRWHELAREADRLQGELSKVVTADMKGGYAQLILGGGEASARRLREAGIPGIRYLDQGSRVPNNNFVLISPKQGQIDEWTVINRQTGKHESFKDEAAARDYYDKQTSPTHNYVVFDDKLISILKKYGLPISAAGLAALSQLHPQEAQAAQQQNLPRY